MTRDEAISKAKCIMTQRNFCEIARSRVLIALQKYDYISESEFKKLLYGGNK